MAALDDMEDYYTRDMQQGYGALSDVAAPAEITDLESRRNIFNGITQKLLEARAQRQAPYQGRDLGDLAFFKTVGNVPGASLASSFAQGMFDRANAEEAQRQAMDAYNQQNTGIDIQAELAKIMGEGAPMSDVAAAAAIGGNDKIADNLSKLQYYDLLGTKTSKGPAALQLTQAYEEALASGDMERANNIATFAKIYEKNQIVDEAGKIELRQGATQAAKEMKKAEEEGKLEGKGEISEIKKSEKGRQQVNTVTDLLRGYYADLDKAGGMVNPEKGAIENVQSFLGNTAAGQTAGKMVGAKNQTIRNKIANIRPLLINAIRNATGMSAKAMDSNAELQFYLKAATDPTGDTPAAMAALDNLVQMYGLDAEKFGEDISGNKLKESVNDYGTAEDIRSAFKSGKISRDEAKSLLKLHGYD